MKASATHIRISPRKSTDGRGYSAREERKPGAQYLRILPAKRRQCRYRSFLKSAVANAVENDGIKRR